MFFFLSHVLPCNRICDKEGFFSSSNLQQFYSRCSGRCLLSLNIGQWRRKCEVIQYLNHNYKLNLNDSWKLCLNLCLHKWVFDEVVTNIRNGNFANLSCNICIRFSGISLRRYWAIFFCKFWRTFLVFCTYLVTNVILNLILGQV